MIALIAIPHQTPAKIIWYDDPQELIDDADLARGGHEAIPRSVADAAHILSSDWSNCLVIESADDIQYVRDYCEPDGRPGGRRHKAHQVAALLDELVEGFAEIVTPEDPPRATA